MPFESHGKGKKSCKINLKPKNCTKFVQEGLLRGKYLKTGMEEQQILEDEPGGREKAPKLALLALERLNVTQNIPGNLENGWISLKKARESFLKSKTASKWSWKPCKRQNCLELAPKKVRRVKICLILALDSWADQNLQWKNTESL